MSIIFIAGVYGVGKSTLCDNVSGQLSIPAFSAGDLISELNGETYGANKVVKDKAANQNILITAVESKLEEVPSFILAGHFCIFNSANEVEILPEFVYEALPISKIILLEAPIDQIEQNLNSRDQKKYLRKSLNDLTFSERTQAQKVSASISVPLYIHKMKFDESDVATINHIISGGDAT